MSAYLGYRVIIDGTAIPENMMVRGSYGATPTERVIYTWTDANQVRHNDISPVPRMEIGFSIRRRTLAEHETIMAAFSSLNNKAVTYWDDKSCTYKTGTFKIDAPQFVSYVEFDALYYMPTAIHMTEY